MPHVFRGEKDNILTEDFMTATADFRTQRIEGYLATTGEQIDCPLFTQITPMLWMGGTPSDLPTLSLPSIFEANLNLYKWGYYYKPEGVEYKEITMYDSSKGVDSEQIWQLATWVYKQARTKVTLVNCQAGLNRSGLVTGAVLTLMGYTPEQAIELMRKERTHLVLANKTFEKWLLENA